MNTATSIRKRALIVKFGQIGDVIMAIPAVRSLYDEGFAIDWACGVAVYPLLQTYSWIRPIGIDDRNILKGKPIARARAIADFWKKTCKKRYNLCATLYYDARFRLLTLPLRADRKISLSRETRSRALLPGRHHTDELIRILLRRQDGYSGQSTGPVAPDIRVPCPLPVQVAPRRIVIVPGGTSNVLGEQILRRWPIENYVVIAREILSRGWEVVLLGGQEDEWTRSYFESLPLIDCIGTLSLPEVISVCDASDAVLCHDTGPLHLAGLSDTCLVGVFGPTDPATRIPRRPYAIGIWGGQGLACRPCYDGTEFAPCRFNGCMHEVTPDIALREMDRLLEERRRNLLTPWKILST